MSNGSRDRLRRNTISSLTYQIVAILCGFVLPRLILEEYGSSVNGLVNSITHFLSVISFLELGVGSVVKSSLYKPCVEKDYKRISEIYKSAQKFFSVLALILLVYVVVLLVLFPTVINQDYDWLFINTLIIAVSIASFAEYYFGTVNSLLLQADQKNAIVFDVRTITLLANTLICYILIKINCSIQVVKITTSLIFLIRPFFLNWYVNHHYSIDKKIQYSSEPIKQKWNGIAIHVASVVLTQTDTIVLTFFDCLESVSIYSVYYMPIVAIQQLIIYAINGYESHMGALWASNGKKQVSESYNSFVWVLHFITVVLYGCAASAIGSFVKVYTRGISDAEYNQPLFGFILILANVLYCFRLPSQVIIKAAGKYKETQISFVLATLINLIISIFTVSKFGLIGVAVGTFCSLLYHSITLAYYTSKHLVNRSIIDSLKQIGTDALAIIIAFSLTSLIKISVTNYINWAISAGIDFLIWSIVCGIVNYFCYKSITSSFIRRFLPWKIK